MRRSPPNSAFAFGVPSEVFTPLAASAVKDSPREMSRPLLSGALLLSYHVVPPPPSVARMRTGCVLVLAPLHLAALAWLFDEFAQPPPTYFRVTLVSLFLAILHGATAVG